MTLRWSASERRARNAVDRKMSKGISLVLSGLHTHVLRARADRTSLETRLVGGTTSPVPVDVDGDGQLDLGGLRHMSDWNDGFELEAVRIQRGNP